MERKLYTQCIQMKITLLSVGHRSTLRHFHQFELNLTRLHVEEKEDNIGTWQMEPIENKIYSTNL